MNDEWEYFFFPCGVKQPCGGCCTGATLQPSPAMLLWPLSGFVILHLLIHGAAASAVHHPSKASEATGLLYPQDFCITVYRAVLWPPTVIFSLISPTIIVPCNDSKKNSWWFYLNQALAPMAFREIAFAKPILGITLLQ